MSMRKELTHDELLEALRKRVSESPSQSKAAKELSISVSFLSAILSGQSPITEKLAAAMGYERMMIFRKAS